MVKLDIDLPETCEECPCSYWIQTGRNAGKLMCNAIEFREIKRTGEYPENCVLVDKASKPGDCPMSDIG